MLEKLAIVIPVGPGDDAWQGLWPSLESLPVAEITAVLPSSRAHDELMLRPTKAKTPRVQQHLRLVVAPAGRASQQNAGACATTAPWLWFVHADSRLEPDRPGRPGTISRLIEFMARGQPAVGYFDLKFLSDGPAAMPLNAWGAGLRSRWLGLPFGDQGLLMPRAVFNRLGGFDERIAGGEDHALIWRARQLGIPVQPVGAPLYTSARKYAEHGWLRTTARHLWLTWRQARDFKRPRQRA